MKQILTTALAVALTINASVFVTSCSNDSDDALASGSFAAGDGSTVAITFSVQGDFSLTTTPITRAALTADGKDMTDLWCLDYVDGTLQQTVHQVSTDTDFGQPTVTLALGSHHLYFVASRGTTPSLDTDDHTLSFAKVLDTFYKDYAITVTTGTSSGNRAVTLDRIVTKLKVLFTDAIPEGAATFSITPHAWHYAFNYLTGNPTAAATDQAFTVAIPSSEIGNENVFVNMFGFSGTTEWTTDIAVNCKASDDAVLGTATITAAPFQRNRVTEFSGPLFTAGSGMTLSLNTAWDDSYQGTW